MARGRSLLYPLATAMLRRTEWPDRASVAGAIGVHRASIQDWLDHFHHHRVIREDHGLRVDVDRLWGLLTAHRVVAQRPATSFQLTGDPSEWSRRLTAAGIPHAFSLFTAANQYAFFEPRNEYQVYLARSVIKQARDVLDAEPGGPLKVFHETVDALPTLTRTGVQVTDPVLTVADLRAHPEGGAHARFLQSTLLPKWTP